MVKLLKSLPREGGDNGLVFIGSQGECAVGQDGAARSGQGDGLRPRAHHSRLPQVELPDMGGGDRSNFPREIIEAALAHIIGDKSEQA